jgi:hypothetical protein
MDANENERRENERRENERKENERKENERKKEEFNKFRLEAMFKSVNTFYKKNLKDSERIDKKPNEIKFQIYIQQMIDFLNFMTVTAEFGLYMAESDLVENAEIYDKKFQELRAEALGNVKAYMTISSNNLEKMDSYFSNVLVLSLGSAESSYGKAVMELQKSMLEKNAEKNVEKNTEMEKYPF